MKWFISTSHNCSSSFYKRDVIYHNLIFRPSHDFDDLRPWGECPKIGYEWDDCPHFPLRGSFSVEEFKKKIVCSKIIQLRRKIREWVFNSKIHLSCQKFEIESLRLKIYLLVAKNWILGSLDRKFSFYVEKFENGGV